MYRYIIPLLFLIFQFGANPQTDVPKRYPPDQLRKDVDYVVQSIVEIHPDPFAYYPETLFMNAAEELKAGLNDTMTRTGFARRIIPLVNLLKDGHTEISIPAAEYEAQRQSGLIFPYEVSVSGRNIFVRLQEGSGVKERRLISLNGHSGERLLEEMRNYTSAEQQTFQSAVIERRFKRLVWLILGDISRFDLRLEAEQEIRRITKDAADAITSVHTVTNDRPNYAFHLNTNLGAGVLEFNSMSGQGEFEELLETAFRTMGSENISKLIIDLRGNSGGNSELGTALLEYIADKPFKQVDRMVVRASQKQKSYIREHYVPWYFYPFVFFSRVGRATFASDGKETEIEFDTENPRSHGFDGEVSVLTSHLTFSSASMLANAVRCYELGTLIGEETGGVTVFFGDNIGIETPHTGLRGTVSFKKFYLPCGEETLQGVQPHIFVEGADHLSIEEVILQSRGRLKP